MPESDDSSAPPDIETCPICYSDVFIAHTNDEKDEIANTRSDLIRTHCGHNFHFDCLIKWMIENNNNASSPASCPMCRSVIDINSNQCCLVRYGHLDRSSVFRPGPPCYHRCMPLQLGPWIIRETARPLTWAVAVTTTLFCNIMFAILRPY